MDCTIFLRKKVGTAAEKLVATGLIQLIWFFLTSDPDCQGDSFDDIFEKLIYKLFKMFVFRQTERMTRNIK